MDNDQEVGVMTTTQETLVELKPCPFCGATDGRLVQAFTRATDTFAYWSVECLDCGCEIADDEGQAQADAAWNRRAPALTTPPIDDVTGSVADGWKLVPVEPTAEMVNAYYEEQSWGAPAAVRDVWSAMLSSSPDYKGTDR